ncbi:MAG: SMC-Scp complex subunit ScpB [Acidobacteria bacterium]|nr:SMC-Scp complex subunit ScpB [Acidobacteriota bacterium]
MEENITLEEALAPEQLGVVEAPPDPESDESRLLAILEAVVYITDEPLSPKQIAEALGKPIELVETVLAKLVEQFNEPHHGLSVREVAGGYKMSTKPEFHEEIRGFVKKLKPPLKLSLAALETLAVIAYKQPITAPEIMDIRGVQGAGVLKTLLDRKLVTTAGRKQVVGRPVLYRTTKEFLVQFGLKDLAELPTLKEFEEWSRLALGDPEEPAAAAVPETAPETVPETVPEPTAESNG